MTAMRTVVEESGPHDFKFSPALPMVPSNSLWWSPCFSCSMVGGTSHHHLKRTRERAEPLSSTLSLSLMFSFWWFASLRSHRHRKENGDSHSLLQWFSSFASPWWRCSLFSCGFFPLFSLFSLISSFFAPLTKIPPPFLPSGFCHEQRSSQRRSSNARQLGCAFQDMTPPKSTLRKGTDMPKTIQHVKFKKAIARHTEIRDQNPLGYICPGEPHERSLNAPKFEDPCQEETEWQELGAREAAWK